jgi:phosphatidylethanolamine-binding protein (PEBP) family uncharacterized protein
MTRATRAALAAAALAAAGAQAPFRSSNISDAVWACGPNLPRTTAFFANTSREAGCGNEILQGAAAAMPTITFADAAAPPGQLYTVLAIDRDAPNRAAGAPRRHGIFVSVPASALAAGLTPASLGAAGTGLRVISNYTGPRPPAGSGCHRYYIFIFAQAAGPEPSFDPTPENAGAWNFLAWADAAGLVNTNATTYWQTQAEAARAGFCGAPSPAPAPADDAASASPLILPVGIAIGSAVFLTAAAALAWRLCARHAESARPPPPKWEAAQGTWAAPRAAPVAVPNPIAAAAQ